MYSWLVAHVMNLKAASSCLVLLGMARFQLQYQLLPRGVPGPTGAFAKPTLFTILLLAGSLSRPAATVASTHMPHLPWLMSVRFSVKPLLVAPGGRTS